MFVRNALYFIHLSCLYLVSGSRRVLDVVDVNTQKGLEMTLKEWVNYFEDAEQHKDRLLNVISLEFSHTRLEDYVDQPRVVSSLFLKSSFIVCCHMLIVFIFVFTFT